MRLLSCENRRGAMMSPLEESPRRGIWDRLKPRSMRRRDELDPCLSLELDYPTFLIAPVKAVVVQIAVVERNPHERVCDIHDIEPPHKALYPVLTPAPKLNGYLKFTFVNSREEPLGVLQALFVLLEAPRKLDNYEARAEDSASRRVSLQK